MKKIYLLLMLLLPAALVWAKEVNVTADKSQTVEAKNTYILTATSEETPTEFELTTEGAYIEANIKIDTTAGDVSVTLNNLRIKYNKPIVIEGSGTVTFNVTNSSYILHDAQSDGITINAPDAHLNFQIASGKNLYISLPAGSGTGERAAVNVLPIYAKSLSVTGGNLRCYAHSKKSKPYVEGYPLTPCIITETLTVYGETTKIYLSFFAEDKFAQATAANQPTPVIYTTLKYIAGTVTEDGNKFPSSETLDKNKRYNYPTSSYKTLKEDAKGGTILDTVIFSFPDWEDFSEDPADYLSCFKSADTGAAPTAEAITIDAEKKTVYIDTTNCPDPELVYAKDGTAGAVDLFGATAGPTAEGIAVTYAFGIDWIGIESGTIQMTVAVDLPYETADTKEFFITVTIEDGSAIFEDNLTFTRVAGTNLFRSARIDTEEDPRLPDFTFHTYHVSASEAKSVTE